MQSCLLDFLIMAFLEPGPAFHIHPPGTWYWYLNLTPFVCVCVSWGWWGGGGIWQHKIGEYLQVVLGDRRLPWNMGPNAGPHQPALWPWSKRWQFYRSNVKTSAKTGGGGGGSQPLGLLSYQARRFPGSSVVKNTPANAGDTGSTPGSERSPGEENGNPFQYSCLGNSRDRGAWEAIVHGVAKESDMT